MSSSYKQQGEQAKLAKRGVVEQRPALSKSKKKQQPKFDLMCRHHENSPWRMWGSYVREEDAKHVAGKWERSGLRWEWKVVPRN